MPEQTTIPRGALFTITTGEYSDYTVNGVFRALVDLDYPALLKTYIGEKEEPDIYKFMAHLGKNKLIEDVDCFELHVGYYGGGDLRRLTRCEDARVMFGFPS